MAYNKNQISNEELTLDHIPDDDAPLDDIIKFGSTFDAYDRWGSLSETVKAIETLDKSSLLYCRADYFLQLRAMRFMSDWGTDDEIRAQLLPFLQKVRELVKKK
jgi:hypothetical protein